MRADDVCETNLTENAEHMMEVEKISTDALVAEIDKLGLTQNRDKNECALKMCDL